MRRFSRNRFIGMLVGWLLLAAVITKAGAGPAQTAPPAKLRVDFATAPVTITKIAGGLAMLSGPGGNIGVFYGPEGVLLIDTGVPGRDADIQRAIAHLAGDKASIRFVLDTHFHADHSGNNAAFAKAGAVVIAHENVRKRLSTEQFSDFLQRKSPAWPAAAWPVLTLGDSGAIWLNGKSAVLKYMPPPAHSDGDVFVLFPELNVLQTGDLFFNGIFPYIDYSSGGSLDGMIAAQKKLLALTDDNTKIIPGHGPLATRKDLEKSIQMLETVRDRIKPLVDAGKTLEEVQQARPLVDLSAWENFLDTAAFTELVYRSYLPHNK